MKFMKKFLLFVVVLSLMLVPSSAFAKRNLRNEFTIALVNKDIDKIRSLFREGLPVEEVIEPSYMYILIMAHERPGLSSFFVDVIETFAKQTDLSDIFSLSRINALGELHDELANEFGKITHKELEEVFRTFFYELGTGLNGLPILEAFLKAGADPDQYPGWDNRNDTMLFDALKCYAHHSVVMLDLLINEKDINEKDISKVERKLKQSAELIPILLKKITLLVAYKAKLTQRNEQAIDYLLKNYEAFWKLADEISDKGLYTVSHEFGGASEKKLIEVLKVSTQAMAFPVCILRAAGGDTSAALKTLENKERRYSDSPEILKCISVLKHVGLIEEIPQEVINSLNSIKSK